MTEAQFRFIEGDSPLLISSPHSGTAVPAEMVGTLTDNGLALVDTDWEVDKLYAPLAEQLGASTISAYWTRYAADLNRSSDNRSLYQERNVSGVVANESFDRAALYKPGMAPDNVEVARRVAAYWQPYHDKITATLAALRARHGYALLWDGHSIRAHVPALAVKEFSILNIGTASGVSCEPSIERAVCEAAEEQNDFSLVVNGFFKGGYITQHHGSPDDRVSAIQLELRQDAYLDPTLGNELSENSARVIRDLILRMMTAYLKRAAEVWG